MRLEKVGAEYKRKFNLGNYESAEIGAIIWAIAININPHR
jgi:hypothetical protein